MMREKDVVKGEFSVLIIMCFERLGGGGGLRIISEDSLPRMGPDVEAVTFFRQGTCRCYKEFTHYHPIIVVL
jgi:hypothetical protein